MPRTKKAESTAPANEEKNIIPSDENTANDTNINVKVESVNGNSAEEKTDLTDDLVSGDEKVSSDMVLDDLVDENSNPEDEAFYDTDIEGENNNSSENDDGVPLDSNGIVMSESMYHLFNDAQYRGKRLTGRIVGKENTKLGTVAYVSYNPEMGNTTQVIIAAENMGLDEKYIDRRAKAEMKQKTFSSEEEKETVYSRNCNKIRSAIISSMIGVKVDFIIEGPDKILRERNIVIGNRTLAMEQKKESFLKRFKRQAPDSPHVGTIGLARILATNFRYLQVEFEGFVVNLSPREVTPLAVHLKKDFKVGDNLRVSVTKITENGISLRGATANIDITKRISQYHKGQEVLAIIYYINFDTGRFYLKLPDGCRGIAYYNKTTLRMIFKDGVKEGDEVISIVTGYSVHRDAVRCSIKTKL